MKKGKNYFLPFLLAINLYVTLHVDSESNITRLLVNKFVFRPTNPIK